MNATYDVTGSGIKGAPLATLVAVDVEETSALMGVVPSAIMEAVLLIIAVLVDLDVTASSLSLVQPPLMTASLPFVAVAIDTTVAETESEWTSSTDEAILSCVVCSNEPVAEIGHQVVYSVTTFSTLVVTVETIAGETVSVQT